MVLIQVSAGYAEPLYHLAEVINQLDAVVGLSVAAVNGNFVRPNVSKHETIEVFPQDTTTIGGLWLHVRRSCPVKLRSHAHRNFCA